MNNNIQGPVPGRPVRNHFRTPGRYSARNLNTGDLDRILCLFGLETEEIYELTPGQRWMMQETGQEVGRLFFLQAILKIKIDLNAADFRLHVDQLVRKREYYRSAFVSSGLSHPYRVILKHRTAECFFYDLSDKDEKAENHEMEELAKEDRSRGFDLSRDSLLRIHVAKLAGKDRYGAIVSQPHINTDALSLGLTLKELFPDYVMLPGGGIPSPPGGDYRMIAEYFDRADRRGDLAYWKKRLKDLPAPLLLPGAAPDSSDPEGGEMSVHVKEISPETSRLLKKAQSRYKTSLNCMMLLAWGIMLQKLYGREDVVFGTITSGRSPAIPGINTVQGGFVNAFPIRIKACEEMKIPEILRRFSGRFYESLRHTHVTEKEIREELGREQPVLL